MTSLSPSESAAATASTHANELSWPRAFWLMARLRLTRWRNRRRQGSWLAGAAASSPRRHAGTARSGASAGRVLGFAALIALFCRGAYHFFENVLREHGAQGLQGSAALMSSLQVSGVLLMGLVGSRVWDPQGDEDVAWLSTLPAPAWVLLAAKLAEAAWLNPVGWMLLFPFFTGLGVHTGLGLMAPLVAFGICLPILLSCGVLGSVIDAAHHALSRSRTFRAVRFIGPMLGAAVFIVWFGGIGLQRLRVDVLGGWQGSFGEVTWLPFSEPARALLAWPAAPLRGLGWLGLFAMEMAALLGLGAFGLNRLYRADLMQGPSARGGVRGASPARERGARRRSLLPRWSRRSCSGCSEIPRTARASCSRPRS